MKPPSEEHDLIRWIDGEMNETESTAFEERLKQDPVLAKEARQMRELSTSIRTHLPAEMRVPHADYFNTQIGVRITQMALDDARAKQAAPGWGAMFQWLRQPWFALAGTAALAVLGQAHHAYKSSPTRATFRTCLDAIKVCQEVGATTQEIKRAQQG